MTRTKPQLNVIALKMVESKRYKNNPERGIRLQIYSFNTEELKYLTHYIYDSLKKELGEGYLVYNSELYTYFQWKHKRWNVVKGDDLQKNKQKEIIMTNTITISEVKERKYIWDEGYKRYISPYCGGKEIDFGEEIQKLHEIVHHIHEKLEKLMQAYNN